MNIREATADDFEALVALIKVMHSEVGTWSWSEAKARNQIADCLSNGVAYVIELDGEIVGSIGLGLSEASWYTTDRMIGDYWNFVHPNARKTRAAKLLMKSARYFAREVGLPFQPGIYGTKDLDRKVGFFTRQGFLPVGVWFIDKE